MQTKWPLVKLDNHIIESKETNGSTDLNGFTVLSVTNDKGFEVSENKTSADLSKYKVVKENFFAYNPYRINVGSIALSRDGQKGIVSPAYVVFYTAEDLDPEYLFLFLKSDVGLFHIGQGGKGSVRSSLSFGKLREIEILLPPISEQRHIVNKFNATFRSIENVQEITTKNLHNSRAVFELYLQKIMNLNDHNWKTKKLGEICEFQGGSQPPKAIFSYQNREGYIRLIQIRDYKSNDYVVYIPKGQARRFCNSEDVMIGRYGPPLFQILRGLEGAYNVALMKAIPDEKEILKDYLYFFLKNKKIQDYVINASSRSAGQTGVNKETLEPYLISYPSIKEQIVIVERLNKLLEQIRKLEGTYKQRLYNLYELKTSILVKNFMENKYGSYVS